MTLPMTLPLILPDTANNFAIDPAMTLPMHDVCLYMLQRSEVVALINEKRRHAMMQLKASLAEVGGSQRGRG
jgi:hypothetical protein